MSRYFTKINSPYKRDPKGKAFIPEFADPVFEENLDAEWQWHYKWDGTSVGFTWGGDPFGRGESSALSWEQWCAVRDWSTLSRKVWGGDGMFPEPTHIYGELVGPGIQGNPHGLDRLEVMTFAYRWKDGHRTPEDWNLLTSLTLREAIAEFRERQGGVFTSLAQARYLPGTGDYFEGIVGYLASDPDVMTKLKVKDKWSW